MGLQSAYGNGHMNPTRKPGKRGYDISYIYLRQGLPHRHKISPHRSPKHCNRDHHTLGVNKTVGAAIASVYAVSTAYLSAANAILNVRSHVNFMQGPTLLFKDLENPSAVVSSIAALLPTVTPFLAALAVVSDIYAYLGSVASSELNHKTTIAPPPPGWFLNTVETEAATQFVSATALQSTVSASVASECPASSFSSITQGPPVAACTSAAGQTSPTTSATGSSSQPSRAATGAGSQIVPAGFAPIALVVLFVACVMAL